MVIRGPMPIVAATEAPALSAPTLPLARPSVSLTPVPSVQILAPGKAVVSWDANPPTESGADVMPPHERLALTGHDDTHANASLPTGADARGSVQVGAIEIPAGFVDMASEAVGYATADVGPSEPYSEPAPVTVLPIRRKKKWKDAALIGAGILIVLLVMRD